MYKILLKITIVLGFFFYLSVGMLQAEKGVEEKSDTSIGKFGQFQVRVGQGFFIRNLGNAGDDESPRAYAPAAGAVVHLFHPKTHFLALSTGFGLNGTDINNNLQIGLGLSALLHTADEEVFALTFGRLLWKEKSSGENASENFTYEHDWFGAVTYTIKFSKLLDVIRGDSATAKETNTEVEGETEGGATAENEATNTEVESETEGGATAENEDAND